MRSSGICRAVAIVDWDVHHGNGTQDILGRPVGAVLPTHQMPLYPAPA
jgi:acetoin utilization deacetylase AcuC-like enzyme